jgi:hypothetical protein
MSPVLVGGLSSQQRGVRGRLASWVAPAGVDLRRVAICMGGLACGEVFTDLAVRAPDGPHSLHEA